MHALGEGVLQLGRRDRERLQLADDVGEPEADQPDASFLDGAQHVLLLALHGSVASASGISHGAVPGRAGPSRGDPVHTSFMFVGHDRPERAPTPGVTWAAGPGRVAG